MSDVPKQPMTMERLNLIEALLTAKLFPNGGYAETRELIEAVRENLRPEREPSVRSQQFPSPTDFALFLGRCDGCDLHFDTEDGLLIIVDEFGTFKMLPSDSSCCKTDRTAKARALAIEQGLYLPQPGATDGK